MNDEMQALCFFAGANSIFYGEKLLTTGNPDMEHDRGLFARLGLLRNGAGGRPASRARATARYATQATRRTGEGARGRPRGPGWAPPCSARPAQLPRGEAMAHRVRRGPGVGERPATANRRTSAATIISA